MRFKSRDGSEKRITSTSGHVVLVGSEFEEVPEHMTQEAFASGCLSEEVWNELKEDIMKAEAGNDAGVGVSASAASALSAISAGAGIGDGVVGDDDVTGGGDAGDALTDPDTRTDDEIRMDMIKKTITETMMNGNRETNFTGAGNPNRNVLNRLCNFRVEAEEAEQAWAEIVESMNTQE